MKLSLIVPVYNEEETIVIFVDTVEKLILNQLKSTNIEIVFINDGSYDNTLNILLGLESHVIDFLIIDFSRNFGKESALFSGLEHCTGDLIIPIDVDLQDPIELIPEMILSQTNGVEVVLAQRINREVDSLLKRKTAELFYKIINKISPQKIVPNVGDFRLMTRKVVNEILRLQENQLFMKGLLSWVGFKYTVVQYKRENRIAGDTKFNGWKLWNLALDGVTSFSTIPLKIWTYLGSFIAFLSFLFAIKVIVEKVFLGIQVSGYASMMVAILFFGGVQLISIGVLGEYLGRIYLETKKRPRYIINEKFIKKKTI